MSERLIALADAAKAVCSRCAGDEKVLAAEMGYAHADRHWWETDDCPADRIRVLVDAIQHDLGWKPISEWRR